MRTKNIAFMIASIFLLVFALGFASATAQFVDNTAGTTITSLSYGTVDQGKTAIVSFKINDPADVDLNQLENLAFNTPTTFTSGTKTFLSESFVSGAVTILADDATSGTMTLSVTVPSNTPAGTYAGTLTLSGDEPAGTPLTSVNLALSITVRDVTKPVISLTGDNPQYVKIGQLYSDLGATATDETDGTLSVSNDGSTVVIDTIEGTYTVTYTTTDTAGNTATKTRTVIVINPTNGLCPIGSSNSNLALSKFDINNKGTGDDNKWNGLDTIEIEVEFENNRNSAGQDLYDLEDIAFELGIFDSTGKNVAKDMIWISKDEEKFDFGDVDEGDDAKHTFVFRVNPEEKLSGDFDVKVKAYPAGKEATDCIDFSSDLTTFGASKYFADISIKLAKDEGAVVVDEENFPVSPTASCEQEVTFTADIWNIGKQDFQDQIKITLSNIALGISQSQVLLGELDQGDMKRATFTFFVPAGMAEKQYDLEMRTFYDYDADDDEYKEFSTETFIFPLKVEGNCVAPELGISASLESGGKAGETLVVKTTVTNTGKDETIYSLSVSGYSGWATSATLENGLTLAPGQSADVLISFDVDKKASGDQTFSIDVSSEGTLIKSQPIQVSVEPRKVFGVFNGDASTPVAILIALISAIAIAVIIILIVRASRR